MKIKEHYPLTESQIKTFFRFNSHGEKGIIRKWIWFQKYKGENRYNLAFGDIINGKLNDSIISNNQDFTKVISTVVQSVYIFFESHPDAILEITPVDYKRLRFYNTIFQRRYLEIEESFEIFGVIEDEIKKYTPDKEYEMFVIQLKK